MFRSYDSGKIWRRGLDYTSYGLMMQELERGDSGVRSTASVPGLTCNVSSFME